MAEFFEKIAAWIKEIVALVFKFLVGKDEDDLVTTDAPVA